MAPLVPLLLLLPATASASGSAGSAAPPPPCTFYTLAHDEGAGCTQWDLSGLPTTTY